MSLEVSHTAGGLEEAERIRQAHPAVVGATMHAAATFGDDTAVAACLAADPGSAVIAGGPRGWDPLTYLCFSRYLRIDRARSGAFVRAAARLLDAGASPNTGFHEQRHSPEPVRYLLGKAAPVEAIDGAGLTPLQLAVRACTVSYWRDRRQPTSIAALLDAGADASSVALPTGYEDADRLLIDKRNAERRTPNAGRRTMNAEMVSAHCRFMG